MVIANPVDWLTGERGVLARMRASVAVAAFRIFEIKSNLSGGRAGGRILPSGAVPGAGALVAHDAGPVMLAAGLVLMVHIAIGFERACRGV